jgi:SAM-dependent methyltransferase
VRACPACGSDRCTDDWRCEDCGHEPTVIDGFVAFAPTLASENEGFHEDYFAELAALEASNFWFRARNKLIVWAMQTYLPECQRFLEIGCGTGFVLDGIRAAFPSAELSGSEIFATGLAFAAARVPSARLYQMDARSIPFRDHFDAIGAFDVLEHIEDDVAVIAEIAKALRPGGGLVLSVPQHPSLWSAQDAHAFHVRRYTAGRLRRKVEAAGFEVIRMTSFVSLLLPMMFVSRRRMRESTPGDNANVDAMGDLRQPRAVNVALEAVMTLERSLIRHGLSFPAGGSLLIVARKRQSGSPA